MRNEVAGKFFSTSCNGKATSTAPGPAWNKPRKLTGMLTSKTFVVTLTRPEASCGSMSAKGSSKRTSGGTQEGSPFNCMGGKLFRIGRSGSAIFTSVTRAVSGTTGVATSGSTNASSDAARLSFVSHGSAFAVASSSRTGAGLAAILKGIRTGGGFGVVAGIDDSGFCNDPGSWPGSSIPTIGDNGEAKEFGTDGPLEAGTLSDASASVPFGESLKGIRLGDCGRWPFVDGAGAIFTIASAAASGSA